MDMNQKNKMIEDYIINISNQVNSQYNGLIDEDKVSRAIEMFSNSSDDFETEIIPKIDKLAQEVIDNYLKRQEENQRRTMLENIDKNINSDFFIEMLRKNWDKSHSIGSLGNLIGELYIHHIINKDGFGFKHYMTEVEKLYYQLGERKISPENFELQRSKLIASVIAYKLGVDTQNITQDSMLKVKNYFLQEYVSNGYVSHSFPEAYFESIMQNGLIATTDERPEKPQEIQEIQDIFMNKGVVSPMGGYPYYGGSGIYYEHDFTKMFKHAIYSPEWFNCFTSSDHTTAYHDKIEKSPYILRSEVDCRRNINDLCANSGLNIEETEKVVQFYEKQYSNFSSPKLNVALISKKTVGKNNISDVAPQDLDLFGTISHVLKDGSRQYTEHNSNAYYGTISPTELGVSVIPNASNYIKAVEYHRETKEHLINPDSNLAILQTVNDNNNRLVSTMIPKVEKAKEIIMNKKMQYENTKNIEIKKASIVEQEHNNFAKRSQSEIQVHQQIKQNNQIIKQQKAQKKQMNKPKVKNLTQSSSNGSSTGSKGFANVITLSLIVSFVSGALCMIIYMLIKGL